ncbi:hypothetical protein MPSEU_000004700 [Mayamaea pseudoterrestris]|nr:hypothetical protein MPSEU_000004700 [Mayamaea pseudoterrestris]
MIAFIAIFDEFLLEQTDFPSPFNVAIFYNIFIPIDQGRQGIARALSIVQEQLDQIGTSFANDKLMSQTAARPSSPPLTIFYSTIGLSGAVTSSFMHHACTVKHGMRCLPLGRHHADGFEEHTLEPLHSFCQRQQHTAHKRRNVSNSISDARFKVIYLHSKGSFHRQRGENDVWRKHLTRAALSEKCLEYGISSLSNSCNVCGLLFYPLWTFFYPGNMWTADCEYVAKLVAPLTHRARLEQAVAATDFLNEINLSLSNWKMTLYETGPGYLGVGRYSSEHWIASHPDVVPCDLSRTARLEHWWEEHSERTANKESVFEKSLAPRHDIHSPYFRLNHSLLDSIVTNPSRADREYFLLTGFLHKWLTIYKQVPSSYSWVWKWFPNGAYWLQTYEKYGNDTVRVLLEGG